MGKVSTLVASYFGLLIDSFCTGIAWLEPTSLRKVPLLECFFGWPPDGAVGCDRHEDIHHGQVSLLLVLFDAINLPSHAHHTQRGARAYPDTGQSR